MGRNQLFWTLLSLTAAVAKCSTTSRQVEPDDAIVVEDDGAPLDGPDGPSIIGSVDKVFGAIKDYDQYKCIERMLCEAMSGGAEQIPGLQGIVSAITGEPSLPQSAASVLGGQAPFPSGAGGGGSGLGIINSLLGGGSGIGPSQSFPTGGGGSGLGIINTLLGGGGGGIGPTQPFGGVGGQSQFPGSPSSGLGVLDTLGGLLLGGGGRPPFNRRNSANQRLQRPRQRPIRRPPPQRRANPQRRQDQAEPLPSFQDFRPSPQIRVKRQTRLQGNIIRLMQATGMDSLNAFPYVRAALIGHATRRYNTGNRFTRAGSTCAQLYKECPTDQGNLLNYLNNHNGGLVNQVQPAVENEVGPILQSIVADLAGGAGGTSGTAGTAASTAEGSFVNSDLFQAGDTLFTNAIINGVTGALQNGLESVVSNIAGKK